MTMMFGAIAAVASSSASFPLEIVRRRAMMGTLPAGSGLHQTRLLISMLILTARMLIKTCLFQACGWRAISNVSLPWACTSM